MIDLELADNRILFGIILSLSISVIAVLQYFVRLALSKLKAKNQVGYVMQIIPPKYSREDVNERGYRFALQRFIDNLTVSVKYDRVSFEIYADNDGVKFLIWTPTKEIQNLIKLSLYSTYADRIKIKDIDDDPVENFSDDSSQIDEYSTAKHDIYMLMDLKDFEAVDPVQDILNAMVDRKVDQKILFQIVLKPTKLDKSALKKAKENFRLARGEITWISILLEKLDVLLIYFIPLLPVFLMKLLTGIMGTGSRNQLDPMMMLHDSDPRKVIVEKEELNDFSNRLNEKYKTAFTTYIRVIATGEDVREQLAGIENALEDMKSETQNRLVKRQSSKFEDLKSRYIYPESAVFPVYREMFTSQCTLSSREISMLYHLPSKLIHPSIDHFVMPEISANKTLKTKKNLSDLFLGINNSRGKETRVYLHSENRKRHLIVTGQTGTGKSTILKKFVLQDIDNRLLKKEKRGLMLLDPHEDFFIDVLQRLPKGVSNPKDLIAWDTRDENWYFGFNPLFSIGLTEREIDLIVDSNFKLIEKMLKRTNPTGGMGATGKPMLLNAMKTLMVFQNEWLKKNGETKENIELISELAPTLIEAKSIITDNDIRSQILGYIDLKKYEGLRSFWEDTLPNYEESRTWNEILQGFDNKLSQILTGVLLYTFGQSQNSIEISDVISNSQILLVNLASQNIGEEGMSLLGSLLMSKVWFEARKIQNIYRKPFVVYADEFQNFATSDFASVLSEARKFKLELILANQFFRQLPDDVFHAVLGNVKSKIYYRCGLEDAPMITKDLQERVLEKELLEIPEYNANVKIGENVFSIYVPEERESNFTYEQVYKHIDDSYKRYAMEKAKIKSLINKRRRWIRDGCLPKKSDNLTIKESIHEPFLHE